MKRDYSLQQAIDLVKGGMEPLEAAKKVYVDHAYYENIIAEVIEREIEIDRLREALKDAESWMRIKIGLTGKDPMDCNQYRFVLKALEQ